MKHLPNVISFVRLILSPCVFVLVYTGDHSGALVLFVVLAVSDALDGMLARIFNAKSMTGKMLDPLADKSLLFFGLLSITFYTHTKASVYLLTFLLARDVFLVLGSLLLRRFGFVPEPTFLGKVTTFSVTVTILFAFLIDLFRLDNFLSVFSVLEAISFFMIVASTFDYALRGFSFLKDKLIMERR